MADGRPSVVRLSVRPSVRPSIRCRLPVVVRVVRKVFLLDKNSAGITHYSDGFVRHIRVEPVRISDTILNADDSAGIQPSRTNERGLDSPPRGRLAIPS